jgi:hypothetical protein
MLQLVAMQLEQLHTSVESLYRAADISSAQF